MSEPGLDFDLGEIAGAIREMMAPGSIRYRVQSVRSTAITCSPSGASAR